VRERIRSHTLLGHLNLHDCTHFIHVAGSGVDERVAECITEASKQMEELGVSCNLLFFQSNVMNCKFLNEFPPREGYRRCRFVPKFSSRVAGILYSGTF
jgi:hypothetical protein